MKKPNIFSYLCYRKYLADLTHWAKTTKPNFRLGALAQASKLQAPYLSAVLKQRSHLSADQFYFLGRELSLEEEELEFGILLIEWERSTNKHRQEILGKKIESIQKQKTRVSENIKKAKVGDLKEEARFFLNPYYTVVLGLLGIARFQERPELIAQSLRVRIEQVKIWLKELQEMGFVEHREGEWRKLKSNFHLASQSPPCLPHQNLLDQLRQQHMSAIDPQEAIQFSLTFSADEKTKEVIREEFLSFLKTIEPLVKSAPAEELYSLKFQMFPWS